jgi:hypothetical protein
MSLRTEFLDELNALAKQKPQDVPSLIGKMKQVMVGRHPATLSPEEQDPITTVALAWKEVAVRGRAAFEAAAQTVITDIDRAFVKNSAAECDWPLAHAVLRLLQTLQMDLVSPARREQIARRLSSIVTERSGLVSLLRGTNAEVDPAALWTDAFRLCLLWHEQQPGWLKTVWKLSLTDEEWPLDKAALVFLEDAARRHPAFVSMDTLVAFWQTAHQRKASMADLRRWYYIIGSLLEDSITGRDILSDLHVRFEAHVQDHQHAKRKLPWDQFIEAIACLFRTPAKQQDILRFMASPKNSKFIDKHYGGISEKFKASPETLSRSLLAYLSPRAEEIAAAI